MRSTVISSLVSVSERESGHCSFNSFTKSLRCSSGSRLTSSENLTFSLNVTLSNERTYKASTSSSSLGFESSPLFDFYSLRERF